MARQDGEKLLIQSKCSVYRKERENGKRQMVPIMRVLGEEFDLNKNLLDVSGERGEELTGEEFPADL